MKFKFCRIREKAVVLFSPGVGVAGLGWERAKNNWLEPIKNMAKHVDSIKPKKDFI